MTDPPELGITAATLEELTRPPKPPTNGWRATYWKHHAQGKRRPRFAIAPDCKCGKFWTHMEQLSMQFALLPGKWRHSAS